MNDIVVLDEDTQLRLGELCRLTGLHAEVLIAWVEEGLIDPLAGYPGRPEGWRFSGATLGRVQGILRLERDLALNASGAALVLDLMDELERLRARVRALETLLHE